MDVFLLALYGGALLLLFTYNIYQLGLVAVYLAGGRKRGQAVAAAAVAPAPAAWPRVTVQLPVYNERYVVERLIDAVAALQYPADKLQIQILDDSTDETVSRIAAKVEQYKASGLDIQHVRRPYRTGYKAGALQYGLGEATGEYIAIFDADFVPDPRFLRQTIPHFSEPRIGVVQTRWAHLNEDYSLLTQLQAFGLNAHFYIEQGSRSAAGHFMNFNGTGGVWRRTAIEDAGGWSHDTLTEDLDLSYRAQLRGWRFLYREDISSPAELPVEINALKAQQYRWMKGAAECARKISGSLLRAPGVPILRKILGLYHLAAPCTFVLVFLIAVLSVPVLAVRHAHPEWSTAYTLINLFQLNLLILLLFYGIPFLRAGRGKAVGRFGLYFPAYSSLMLGLSLHNTIAVLEGYAGRKTPFVRTPKFAVRGAGDSWAGNAYVQRSTSWLPLAEAALALYFAGGIGLGIWLGDYSMVVLHVMLVVGYGAVAATSLLPGTRGPRRRTARPVVEGAA